jgi:O-antigen ligase
MVVITIIYSTDNPLNRSYLTVPQRAFSVFDREDTSINMRLIMLHSSLKMIQARPLLGFGLGTFELCYPDFQGDYLQEKPGMINYLSDKM